MYQIQGLESVVNPLNEFVDGIQIMAPEIADYVAACIRKFRELRAVTLVQAVMEQVVGVLRIQLK
jgi:hypothetical protein